MTSLPKLNGVAIMLKELQFYLLKLRKINFQPSTRLFIQVLQLSAFTVLLGRAYQFYFFGAPYRAILWDESLMAPIVEGFFNVKWFDYATSAQVNAWIELATKLSSIILLLGSLMCLFWYKIPYKRIKQIVIYISIAILVFMSICMVKDKSYDVLQLFEQSLQLAAPISLLILSDKKYSNIPKVEMLLKFAILFTFVSHGLFAMGIIYVPGHFIDMTINILGVTETFARQFLLFAGILDIVCATLLFFPKTAQYVIWYLVIWGFLTALARIVSGFNIDFLFDSLHDHAYLTVYRFSHGLLPLGILLLLKNKTYQHDL